VRNILRTLSRKNNSDRFIYKIPFLNLYFLCERCLRITKKNHKEKYSKYSSKQNGPTKFAGVAIIRPSSSSSVYYSVRFDDGNRVVFQPPRCARAAETSRHFEMREARATMAAIPQMRFIILSRHKSDERSYTISGFRVRATSTMRTNQERRSRNIADQRGDFILC